METAKATLSLFEGVQPEMLEMFEDGERKGFWFFSLYQRLWWSPEELATMQRDGKYRWEKCNFTLRDPMERLAGLQGDVVAAQVALERFVTRLRLAQKSSAK